MVAVVPRPTFPAALVTEARAKYWRSQWMVQLTHEMHKANPSPETVERCEEHIAMASIAVEALKN